MSLKEKVEQVLQEAERESNSSGQSLQDWAQEVEDAAEVLQIRSEQLQDEISELEDEDEPD